MQANDRLSQDGASGNDGRKSREELQSAARTLIDDLRRRQEPPEQILVQIKRFLADSGLKSSFPPADGSAEASGAALYRDIITWSIRYYYEPDGHPPEA